MEELTTDGVINKLRMLTLNYIRDKIGSDPARLPQHFSEFLGYATLLYDYYAEYIKSYEIKEADIIKSESLRRDELNTDPDLAKSERITVTEVQRRIDVRLGTIKAERKRLEQTVKGATIHINGCQSLMKNWQNEAKGIM